MHKQRLLSQLPPLQTPSWLQGGHFQTAYALSLRPRPPVYRRELIADSYGTDLAAYDFVDADQADQPLVVLFHGLEGSSRSHYAAALMQAVQKRGWNGVTAHFRSCGGVASQRLYHSGDTREIAHMLSVLAQRYHTIYAVGVSLGGNALAKYLGEQAHAALPRAAAVVSAPVNLTAAANALGHGLSRHLYPRYFLHSLLKKVPKSPKKIRSLGDFDNAYTAPIHGFADKDDYYRRAAALPWLKHISVPTLLLNAQNDPFLPATALPRETDVSGQVYLLQPENGGHCGFVSGTGRGHLNWLPETLLQFFELSHNAEAVQSSTEGG